MREELLPDSDVLTLSVWCRSSDELKPVRQKGEGLKENDNVSIHVRPVLPVLIFSLICFYSNKPLNPSNSPPQNQSVNI